MAIIKSYSDLQQSKKLAEFLPLESADMRYHTISHYNPYPCDEIVYTVDFGKPSDIDVPCWSLAALLGVLPKIGSEEPMIQKLYYANTPTERYICLYSFTNITGEYDNPVDACVAMIEKLHELNLL